MAIASPIRQTQKTTWFSLQRSEDCAILCRELFLNGGRVSTQCCNIAFVLVMCCNRAAKNNLCQEWREKICNVFKGEQSMVHELSIL